MARNREGTNYRTFRLPVSAGKNTDGFAEDVTLLDINNYVMLKDGSGIRPREGFEIRRNDAIGYGTSRKLISAISNPPDIDYGDMIIITNTFGGRSFVEATEVVRTTNTVALENPTPMPAMPGINQISLPATSGTAVYGAPFSVPVTAINDGGTAGWEAEHFVSFGSGGGYTLPYGSGTVTSTQAVPGSINLTAPALVEGATYQTVTVRLVPPITVGTSVLYDSHVTMMVVL